MIKSLGWLGLGAAAGAIVVAIAMQWRPASENLAVYREAAAIDDAASLDSRLAQVVTQPESAMRDVELDALLARLATLDPERAARFVATHALDETFTTAVYADWAAADPNAALAALVEIDHPARRRTAALAVLGALGDDAPSAERVAATFPAAERPLFFADWLGRRAESNPGAALDELFVLSSRSTQRIAAERIGAVWAERDPEAALRAAPLLPDDLRSGYRQRVLDTWGRFDAGGLLAYMQRAELDALESANALTFLAASPEAVLTAAERVPGTQATTMRMFGFMALAERDREAAFRRVEALPAGPEREQVVSMVAAVLAMSDPDTAAAWIERALPSSPNAQMMVAVGLAERDPVRALDMLKQRPPGPETQLLLGLVASAAGTDPDKAAAVATELATRTDAQSRSLVANVVSAWSMSDPDGALGWVLTQESGVDPALLGSIAARMAQVDALTAASYVQDIPAEHRDTWIVRVAGPYGRTDPNEAVAWLAQFRDRPVYEQAVGQVATASAQTNPDAAARLLSTVSVDVQRGAANGVATSWARRDPDAATRWATSLPDADARTAAIRGAAQGWAATDPAGAQRWTLTLPRGAERDEALAALVLPAAQRGSLDATLLDAFSSSDLRQQSLRRAVPAIARRDPARARALLDEYVDDTAVRQEIEAQTGLAAPR